ncbi:Putative ribonuclease H protein At1g65750 [Linum perenne]
MERLSHLIDEQVQTGRWKPITLSAEGPRLSHLFYADDLILLSEATPCQAEVILQCLDAFCDASGQAVNKEKSVCFCSPNTLRSTASTIAGILGFSLTQNLGRYLGVPILHERTSTQTYQGIVDRITQKLMGWKVKSLSLAGRVTLAQSVLAAIPAYVMQTAVIPSTTCEIIDRLIQNFVWGSTEETQKVHLIAWDDICKPKEEGDLASNRLGS